MRGSYNQQQMIHPEPSEGQFHLYPIVDSNQTATIDNHNTATVTASNVVKKGYTEFYSWGNDEDG